MHRWHSSAKRPSMTAIVPGRGHGRHGCDEGVGSEAAGSQACGACHFGSLEVLGGSWVVLSKVTHIRGLIFSHS